MPSRFDQDFAKGFTSTFGNAFSDGSSNWLRMQQLRQEIENNNFTRDQYLQKRRQESDKLRRDAGTRKKVVNLYKERLRTSLTDLPEEERARYSSMLDAEVDTTPEVLNEYLTNLEKGITDSAARHKTVRDQQKLANKAAAIRKSAQNKRDRGEWPDSQVEYIEALLEGGTEAEIAQANADLKWKPEKVDKKTLAEEKADLREEIDSLGDGDFNAGFEQLKQVDPPKYSRANALGIKKVKSEDETNTEKLYSLIITQINGRNKDELATPVEDYAKQWIDNREPYLRSVYGAKAVDTVKSQMLKDAIFGAGTTDEQIQSSMMKTAPQPIVPAQSQPAMQPPVAPMQSPMQEPVAPDTTQQPPTPADPDEQRVDEIMAKPDDQVTPEERAFLEAQAIKRERATQ